MEALVGRAMQLPPLLHIAFYDHLSFLDLPSVDILLHLAVGVGCLFLRDVGDYVV
jgi:hypothetical protein